MIELNFKSRGNGCFARTAAVARKGGAMEAETIGKNGRNPKSHTSRGNILNICIFMNSLKIIFLTVIAGGILSGCSSMLKSGSVTTVDITHTGVIQKPIIVDLDVNQTKVTGNSNGKSIELQMLKNEAVKNALAGKADVLVEPNFSITSKGGKSHVEVTGFPASYKNFRGIEPSDTTWLKNTREIYHAKVYDTTEKQTATSGAAKKKGLFSF